MHCGSQLSEGEAARRSGWPRLRAGLATAHAIDTASRGTRKRNGGALQRRRDLSRFSRGFLGGSLTPHRREERGLRLTEREAGPLVISLMLRRALSPTPSLESRRNSLPMQCCVDRRVCSSSCDLLDMVKTMCRGGDGGFLAGRCHRAPSFDGRTQIERQVAANFSLVEALDARQSPPPDGIPPWRGAAGLRSSLAAPEARRGHRRYAQGGERGPPHQWRAHCTHDPWGSAPRIAAMVRVAPDPRRVGALGVAPR